MQELCKVLQPATPTAMAQGATDNAHLGVPALPDPELIEQPAPLRVLLEVPDAF